MGHYLRLWIESHQNVVKALSGRSTALAEFVSEYHSHRQEDYGLSLTP